MDTTIIKHIIGDKNSAKIKYRLSLEDYARSYLKSKGWDRSVYGNRSIDTEGPTPWITYPAMVMLKRICRPEWKVFEYGCGNSSLWWGQQVSRIVSVEDDEVWAQKIRDHQVQGHEVALRREGDPVDPTLAPFAEEFLALDPKLPTSGDRHADAEGGLLCREFTAYAVELARFEPGTFDVVVVDGMARSLSAFMAAKFVKSDGIILFDNSDRWQYGAGFEALKRAGFRRIDFWGTGPVNTYEWCTSIFCRTLDCFDTDNNQLAEASDLGW